MSCRIPPNHSGPWFWWDGSCPWFWWAVAIPHIPTCCCAADVDYLCITSICWHLFAPFLLCFDFLCCWLFILCHSGTLASFAIYLPSPWSCNTVKHLLLPQQPVAQLEHWVKNRSWQVRCRDAQSVLLANKNEGSEIKLGDNQRPWKVPHFGTLGIKKLFKF